MSLPREFLYELHKHFTGDIRTDLASRILYSTDASIYQIEPLGVTLPRRQDDLIAAVELAAQYKIPILPRGAGTSLAGQAIGNSLILDCSRWLNNIIEINHEEQYVIVEPGVVLSSLNLAASKYGLMYGPDPASADRATLGGIIANNATGARSIVYGMSADHLLSADVVLSDGSLATWGELTKDELRRMKNDKGVNEVIHSTALNIREKYADAIKQNYPKTWRNSAGYRINYLLPFSPSKPSQWVSDYPSIHPFDGTQGKPSSFSLHPLLAGSEGTLAVIRRAKVNLVPKPKHTILAVLSYQSIADACDDVPRLLTHHPSAIELIPQLILRQARSVPAYASQMGWVIGDPSALLIVEFSGDQPSALKACVERCRNDAARKIGDVMTVAESKEDQARVWNVRKVGLGLLDSRPQSARPIAFIEDCAIPVDKLGEFVREVEKILSAHNTYGGMYAHASAGCLHIRPMLDLKTGEATRSMRSIAEATLALTLRLGGSMSSEHGDGIARSEWLRQTYGDDVIHAMQMLKQAADPEDILNPGKLFDAPKMDSNLRYDENYRTQTWTPVLDFSRNGSLTLAIEQCNGQGVCRKDTGVMCPSYQATRDEMHSTRGRANLLRALISSDMSLLGGRSSRRSNLLAGKGIASSLTSFAPRNDMVESVAEALDLCLACKGCKAECPSGVDMAKLKYEFENQYYKTHRRPLRDYAFGYFHVVAALASSIAPLTNAMMQIPAIKNIAAKILGITPHRPFPKFVSEHAQAGRIANPTYKKIIFLSDPFARYIEPETEHAAINILSACGYAVHVLPVIGAGASLLSKGFIDAAKLHAARLLDALNQIDPAREAAVVGLEPPEIYTLKHEYVDLLPGRAEEIHPRKIWLLDEFLLRSEEFNALRVAKLVRSSKSSEPPKASEPPNSKSPNPINNVTTKIYFHPHCHQRAEGLAADGLPNGTNATLALLRACGYDVELIDSGCCGMAGAFGYEAEHYDLSMKIGELKLFPFIRQLTPSVRLDASPKFGEFGGGRVGVVSTGAACRMQIKHGTGADAVHPIMLVWEKLNGIIQAETSS